MKGIKFLKDEGFVEIDGYGKNKARFELMNYRHMNGDDGKMHRVYESLFVDINKREKQLVVGYVKDFSKTYAKTIIRKFGIKMHDPRIETEENYIYYNFLKTK